MPLVRRWASVVSAALLTVAVGPLAIASAYPSETDIERARQSEQAAGDAVAAIEAQLGALSDRLDELAVSAARAAEAYNGARIALADAEDAEAEAEAHARSAAEAAAKAREELGRVAAATYRAGGQFAGLEMVIRAADAEEFLDTAAVLQTVTRSQGATYDRAVERTAEAERASAEAERALRARQDAAAQARGASEAASTEVAAQEAVLASAERERDGLLSRLADARGTTVALEEERQAGLAAEAAAERQRAEAARAERERASSSETTAPETETTEPADGVRVPDEGPEREPTPEPAPEPAPETSPPSSARPSPTPSTNPSPSPSPSPSPTASARPSTPPPAASPPPSSSGAERAIAYARAQVGKPYQWGAAGPSAFDCSGLTMRAWQQGGKSLPHWSVAQARATTRVSYGQLRPGDLIFWSDNGQPSGTYHVGLYIGGGQMIHAPRPGRPVEVQNVFYWRTPSFYGRV